VKYKITIPEPCHEDWSKMTPQEKGRFCNKCDKCVIDFTGLSTQLMFNHINSGKDICGRFRPDQLNRDLVAAPVKKGFSFQWALTSVIAFTGFHNAFGQSEEPFTVGKIAPIETYQHPETTVIPPPPVVDSLIISGLIVDSETGEPIPFANIYCFQFKVGAISDFDGKFVFRLPSKDVTEPLKIEVTSVGYEDAEIVIEKGLENQTIVMNVQLNVGLMGDVCIVKDTPRNRFKSWFKSVF